LTARDFTTARLLHFTPSSAVPFVITMTTTINTFVHRFERLTAIELLGGASSYVTCDTLARAMAGSSKLRLSLVSLASSSSSIARGPALTSADVHNSTNLANALWGIAGVKTGGCTVQRLVDGVALGPDAAMEMMRAGARALSLSPTRPSPSSRPSPRASFPPPTAVTADVEDLVMLRMLYDFRGEGPGELESVARDELVVAVPLASLLAAGAPAPPEGWLLVVQTRRRTGADAAADDEEEQEEQVTGYVPESFVAEAEGDLSAESRAELHSPLQEDTTTTVVPTLSALSPLPSSPTARPASPLASVAASLSAGGPGFFPSSSPSPTPTRTSSAHSTAFPHFSIASPPPPRAPVFHTRPAGVSAPPAGPGPLTVRKQLVQEARAELDFLQSGGAFGHRRPDDDDDDDNNDAGAAEAEAQATKKQEQAEGAGTSSSLPRPSLPPVAPATAARRTHRRPPPPVRSPDLSRAVARGLLASPVARAFRGGKAEADILASIRVAKYNFGALGPGELSLRAGDHVLPMPDQRGCPQGWLLVFLAPEQQEADGAAYAIGYVPTEYLVTFDEFEAAAPGPGSEEKGGGVQQVTASSKESAMSVADLEPAPSGGAAQSAAPAADGPAAHNDEGEGEGEGEDDPSLEALLSLPLPSAQRAADEHRRADSEADAYVQGFSDALQRLRVEVELSLRELEERSKETLKEARLAARVAASAALGEGSLSAGWSSGAAAGKSAEAHFAKVRELEEERASLAKQHALLLEAERRQTDVLRTRVEAARKQRGSGGRAGAARDDEAAGGRGSRSHSSSSAAAAAAASSSSVYPDAVPSLVRAPLASALVGVGGRSGAQGAAASASAAGTGGLSSSSVVEPSAARRRRPPPLPPVAAQLTAMAAGDRRVSEFASAATVSAARGRTLGEVGSGAVAGWLGRGGAAVTPAASLAPPPSTQNGASFFSGSSSAVHVFSASAVAGRAAAPSSSSSSSSSSFAAAPAARSALSPFGTSAAGISAASFAAGSRGGSRRAGWEGGGRGSAVGLGISSGSAAAAAIVAAAKASVKEGAAMRALSSTAATAGAAAVSSTSSSFTSSRQLHIGSVPALMAPPPPYAAPALAVGTMNY
jgi:hypothetical protein